VNAHLRLTVYNAFLVQSISFLFDRCVMTNFPAATEFYILLS